MSDPIEPPAEGQGEDNQNIIDDVRTVQSEQPRNRRRWLRLVLGVLAAPLILALLTYGFFSTSIGKRVIADQISSFETESGLSVAIGRVEGNVLGEVRLVNLDFRDRKGSFLTVKEATLDWRPLSLIWDGFGKCPGKDERGSLEQLYDEELGEGGLKICRFSARKGRLSRLPDPKDSDTKAPTLPNFDIRAARIEIENLIIAPGVATEEAQRVDLTGEADIRAGRVLVEVDGTLGERDRIKLTLIAEPDREPDRFDLALDYRAPADGVIAGLAGISDGYRAKITGDGSWSSWLGHGVLLRDNEKQGGSPEQVAAFKLANRSGQFDLAGQVYPGLPGDTILGRAAGDAVSVLASVTFKESTLDGRIRAITTGIDARGSGAIDLTANRVDGFNLAAQLLDPTLFGESVRLSDAELNGVLSGTFGDLALAHTLNVGELQTDFAQVFGITQRGTARYDGEGITVPLSASVDRLVTGSDYADPSLRGGSITGALTFAGTRLAIEGASVRFPDVSGSFDLVGDTARGEYGLAGPFQLRRLPVDGFGFVSGTADVSARFGTTIPWSVNADLDGRLDDVANETIADLAGTRLDFTGQLGLAADRPITLDRVVLDSERLDARFDSRIIAGSRTTLVGTGEHIEYGSFTFDAIVEGTGPRAVLVLDEPNRAAGLKNVRVKIEPSADGFAVNTTGQSLLGEFDGKLGLVFPANAPTRINITRLAFDQTIVDGELTLQDSLVSGPLTIAGGGLDGLLTLSGEESGEQSFALDLNVRDAAFDGATQISLDQGVITLSGKLPNDDLGEQYDLVADASGTGLTIGGVTVAQFVADADIEDGAGKVDGTLSGRRVGQFELKFDAQVIPDRIELLLAGFYGRQRITMPRRAVLTSREEGGYLLAPAQLNYARGFTILEGVIGGADTVIEAQFADMPLRLADLAQTDLALGGRVSGVANYRFGASGLPTGEARLTIDNFTRSSLLLSSRPLDVAADINLTANELTAFATLTDDGTQVGELTGSITELGPGDDVVERISNGRLNAVLNYDGRAEALWRLAANDTFDITGPLQVVGRATGQLSNLSLGGTLSGNDLRLQSAVSGTDITGIDAQGRFEGSQLILDRFTGTPRVGGAVSGSGVIDLGLISPESGPGVDLFVAVREAPILDANGLEATLTGPLRIVSGGVGGTIAGKVVVNRAYWKLGTAEDDVSLPRIPTREINRRDGSDALATNANAGTWFYRVEAEAEADTGPGPIEVEGLGLRSRWVLRNFVLKGTVDDPRIGGSAILDRGTYTFAGTRFELMRGRILFDENVPINPQLDIIAQTARNGTDVAVSIQGNALEPSITLSSQPPLPQEEILAQLLFGGSVTNLSPTDALQLAAALAALRGGDGTDPIGGLRRSIGLDQLRIVAADPIMGQRTGVALGKYLGNQIYVELITDGQGYTATQLEYRITSWLALLGTVSTIGRDSAVLEISRDY